VGFRPRSFFSSGAPPRLGASQHRTQDTSCPSSSEPRTAPPGFCILLSALPVLIYDPRAVPQGDPRRRPAPRLPGRSPPPPRSRPRQRPAQRCCCRSGPRCPHEGEVRLGRAIEAARPCRRGDRISDAFAAMHMSPIGTKWTCSSRRSMSAYRGKADSRSTLREGLLMALSGQILLQLSDVRQFAYSWLRTIVLVSIKASKPRRISCLRQRMVRRKPS
jgi:hypothetical protein